MMAIGGDGDVWGGEATADYGKDDRVTVMRSGCGSGFGGSGGSVTRVPTVVMVLVSVASRVFSIN